jgi:hypothetical protein
MGGRGDLGAVRNISAATGRSFKKPKQGKFKKTKIKREAMAGLS